MFCSMILLDVKCQDPAGFFKLWLPFRQGSISADDVMPRIKVDVVKADFRFRKIDQVLGQTQQF